MKESDLKRQIEDFLEYGMNQGKWYWDRLNSGSVLVKKGNKFYKVNLCREGTADLMVLQYLSTFFFELKGDKGKQSPKQKAFQELVEAQGAVYQIVRSLEDVQEILE